MGRSGDLARLKIQKGENRGFFGGWVGDGLRMQENILFIVLTHLAKILGVFFAHFSWAFLDFLPLTSDPCKGHCDALKNLGEGSPCHSDEFKGLCCLCLSFLLCFCARIVSCF